MPKELASTPRTQGTRSSLRSSSRSACSTLGDLPRRELPRPKMRPRGAPLGCPPGEAPDPLARLGARELRERLAHHVLELRHPVFDGVRDQDRKSTRLNSSHANISYAVFCL